MDTIVAISTPLGSGGIGVIRMSGKEAKEIASKVFATKKLNSFMDAEPNYMYLGNIDEENVKEKCFAVYFKSPNSYTGEDVVEFQCHGGVALVNKVVDLLLEKGAKLADRGEFTRRAFINGKMALADCEGVIEMINADSDASLNAGYRLMEGKLSKQIVALQDEITDLLARGEASLDYPEELEEEVDEYTREKMKSVKAEIENLVDSYTYGRIVKEGVKVALVGKTNVGKSSMLNAFLGKERAIVTDIAGTTRDVIEESVEVGGIKITFTDTAGIRESDDVVEKVGIEKAKSELKSSDIVLYVVDVEDKEKDEEFEKLLEGKKVIRVVNKIDKVEDSKDFEDGVIPVSCKTGENVKKVLDEIVNAVSEGKVTSGGETVVLKRHYQAIVEAKKSIDEVYYNYDMMDNCLRLMELKNAWNKLGEVTGTTATEDIIDAIFSKFCLGK
ncbi:MAG: tRNA uridine-5-carboxymethylaminomethyl(34) synthesis GTPase MnmE [Eubacteriales bacterium]|nr:tRNA uridine-5-carboxymethylaminomethyl(34) synthesis GTPase MnmE [Eubacteriales bacterium]